MRRFYCDKCGEEVKLEPAVKEDKRKFSSLTVVFSDQSQIGYDYCRGCTGKLIEFLGKVKGTTTTKK